MDSKITHMVKGHNKWYKYFNVLLGNFCYTDSRTQAFGKVPLQT